MSLLDTASLIVTPNGYKEGKLYSVIPSDGSGDLSVTRATTATRVNSVGLVELVPYNYIRYSEDFTNGNWVKLGTALTVTANTTIAPNGTLTADTLNVSNNDNILYQSASSGFDFTGNTYTFSIYAKGSGTFAMNIRLNSATTTTQTKTLTSEWQRFDVSVTNSVAVTSIEAYMELNTSSTYYVWGAQLVEGSVAKDYQKTETRLNIPRLDYSNGTCPSILVEPQRTNRALYSSSLDNATWSNGGGATITANATTAPDGTLTADRVQFVTGSAGYIYQTLSGLSAGSVTLSGYFKSVSGNATIGFNDGNFNANSINITDEWQRYTFTFNYAGGGIGFQIDNYFGVSPSQQAKDFYVWGLQAEAGSYATSYIPTTSASVTRNADDIKKTGASSLIGQSEGTIFFDGVLLNKQNQYVNIFNTNKDVTNISSWALFWDTTNWRIIFVLFKGNGTFDSSVYLVSSQNFYNTQRLKIAVRYKNGDTTMYINGVQQATSTNSYTINGTKSELFIAEPTVYFGYQDPTECNAAALWKQGLTNAQLATLTTI